MSIKSAVAADKKGNQVIAKALADGNTLTTGTKQTAVRWMERMLKFAGFNPGKLDTSFDGATARALKSFQAARGLKATGVLDAKTFAHLKTVERIIGFKRGTGGTSGAAYLAKALELRFFPELWSVRTSI